MTRAAGRTDPRDLVFSGVKGLLFDGMRSASRAATYALYEWKYNAPLYPTRLYYVDPCAIERIPVEKPRNSIPLVSGVKGGDWDVTTRRVEDDVVYRSFEQRFDEERSWETTEYHSFMQDRLEDTSPEWSGYETMDDIYQRYESLDRLYKIISRDGYVSQQDL